MSAGLAADWLHAQSFEVLDNVARVQQFIDRPVNLGDDRLAGPRPCRDGAPGARVKVGDAYLRQGRHFLDGRQAFGRSDRQHFEPARRVVLADRVLGTRHTVF